jgi:phosphoribosylformimino-5-aminoimidazole carboxamide ribonucleotide (ProFAR) isomerase
MSYLELLPAVDVKDGRAVRLVQGELSAETTYGNPLEVALEFQAAGAEWLHLVDLDAAFGRGENSALLAEVVGKLDIKVELSGGIRDDESLRRALATGCTRINLGTAALENPEWTAKMIQEYGDRIAVGLDVRVMLLQMSRKMELCKDRMCNFCKRYVLLPRSQLWHRVEFLPLPISNPSWLLTPSELKVQSLVRLSMPEHLLCKRRWS